MVQVTGLAAHALAGQPGEGECFHLIGGYAELVARCNVDAGQLRAKPLHQGAVARAAAADHEGGCLGA